MNILAAVWTLSVASEAAEKVMATEAVLAAAVLCGCPLQLDSSFPWLVVRQLVGCSWQLVSCPWWLDGREDEDLRGPSRDEAAGRGGNRRQVAGL